MRVRDDDWSNVGVQVTFAEWLAATQKRRDFLTEYGKEGSPSLDINASISHVHEAEEHRDKAKSFLIQAKAAAMFQIRKEFPELNSREREAVEKDRVKDFQAIVDACESTVSSCVKRYFSRR